MSRAKRPVLGDVFLIPLNEHSWGVGQIVGKYRKDGLFFAIFDQLVAAEDSEDVAVKAANSSAVLFLGLSFDAKIYAGHWVVVGNEKIRSDMPLPAYLEVAGDPPAYFVVDYSGHQRRAALSGEIERLSHRTMIAPVRLEKALKAHFGLGAWSSDYDELRADAFVTTREMFN